MSKYDTVLSKYFNNDNIKKFRIIKFGNLKIGVKN